MTDPVVVAMDGRPLQSRPRGGVGRGLAEVVPLLPASIEVVVLTNGRQGPAASGVREVSLSVPLTKRGAPWIEWAVPRWLARSRPDLFHGTFNVLPRRQLVPTVVTIADLTFEERPDLFPSRAQLLVMRSQARHAARSARMVITGTAHVGALLSDRYGVGADRLRAVPWAVAPSFVPGAHAGRLEELMARNGIRRPYLLTMGGAPRRGLDISLDAWRELRAGGHPHGLVVVGPEALPEAEGLVSMGAAADWEWEALLAHAAAFSYPTAYEGFGMPALEALASGTPVCCPKVGALPEVLGEAAEWCDERSVPALVAALRAVLDDDDRAGALRRSGLERVAAAPTWSDVARLLAEVYREAV